jgi:hypothetical protein
MEHGIIFGKPHISAHAGGDVLEPNSNVKFSNKVSGTSYSGSTLDYPEILIPLTIIDDKVFCIAIVKRTSSSPTEYDVISQYQGSPPVAQPYHMSDTERLSYFVMPQVKSFIKDWKTAE